MPLKISRKEIAKISANVIVNIEVLKAKTGSKNNCVFCLRSEEEETMKTCKKTFQHVFTMVVPSLEDGKENHEKEKQLLGCYEKALEKAVELKCESIVFPLLSQEVSGWPQELWLQIAVKSFQNFLKDKELQIILAVERKSDFRLSQEIIEEMDSYIYMCAKPCRGEKTLGDYSIKGSMRRIESREMVPCGIVSFTLEKESFESSEKSFHEKLFELIERSGMDNRDVWRLANLDRKLFSKIQCNVNYHPKKKTVMALCIALKLNLEESKDLLSRADWAFRPNSKFDLIVEKAICEKQYDITKLNLILFQYTNEILGS